jgi:hypothetical protein
MTAQTGDLLKVGEGFAQEEYYLLSTEPLESYLESIAPKFRFTPPDSSLWRGYRATWQIDKDDRLMLIDFRGYTLTEAAKGVQYLFPGESRVFAYWFTGVLVINVGQVIEYKHRGYESIFENMMSIDFLHGIAIKINPTWIY